MDPIANMISQLKNAGNANLKETEVPYSKINLAILEILRTSGFITSFAEEKKENQKYPYKIKVTLKYKSKNELTFNNIRRVSRPGRRIYIGAGKIHQVSRGKAEVLISTSQGVMNGKTARKKGLGGELICEVW